MQQRFLCLSLGVALTLCSALTGAAETAKVSGPKAQPGATTAAAAKPIDINSASRAELKTLPGIGDAEADRIIKARPYPSKAKLVVDKVLTETAYAALKGRIVAGQKAPPASAKAKS